jgi:hypothetical protein
MAKGKINPAAVQRALTEGPRSNKEIRETLGLSVEKYDPRLDRKLQQLRKDGKIHLINGRWAMNTIHTCPTCQGKGWVEGESAPP